MTYGENAGVIRQELTTLLRQHRIQQRIGGPGSHTIPTTTTDEERGEIGRVIQRYRMSILKWCDRAAIATSPNLHLSTDSRRRLATPDVQLLRCLSKTIEASSAVTPSVDELTTAHTFALVESWRQAAKAAALGEHDFGDDLGRGHLDINQSLTVVKDVAEIVRALLVLDRRYAYIPSWESLRSPQLLQRAAEACAFISADDYSVDRRGWRPPTTTIDGPPRGGIAGVIQAEHNLLVHLNAFPNALNFKRVVDSQRQLSELASWRFRADAPELGREWADRSRLYAHIHHKARNIGGLVGSGGLAVAEGANAISRLSKLPADKAVSQRALRDLDRVFKAVDRRLSELFERGVKERLYFARMTVPRIVENDGRMIHQIRERFMPITSATQAELVSLIRNELRPPEQPMAAREGARASREDLRKAISHRPSSPDASLEL